MNLSGRVERLARDTGIDRPCWACEWGKASGEAFLDYFRARRMKLPVAEVRREYHCAICGRQWWEDVTGYPPELFELERDYARALASHDMPQIERWRTSLSEKQDEWGCARYGEHYTGAIKACVEATEVWFEKRRDDLSDDDLQRFIAGYVARHAPEALPLAP